MDQRPEVRIGTAERERAQNALNEHFSEGRLDMAEFEERSSLAAAARTFGELQPIFADLPGGLPALFPAPVVKAARRARSPRLARPVRSIPVGALVLFVLLLVLASHGWLFFLLFPMFGAFHHPNSPGGRGQGPRYPKH